MIKKIIHLKKWVIDVDSRQNKNYNLYIADRADIRCIFWQHFFHMLFRKSKADPKITDKSCHQYRPLCPPAFYRYRCIRHRLNFSSRTFQTIPTLCNFLLGSIKGLYNSIWWYTGLKHPMWNANLTQPVHGSRAYSDVRRWHGYCTLYEQFPHYYRT